MELVVRRECGVHELCGSAHKSLMLRKSMQFSLPVPTPNSDITVATESNLFISLSISPITSSKISVDRYISTESFWFEFKSPIIPSLVNSLEFSRFYSCKSGIIFSLWETSKLSFPGLMTSGEGFLVRTTTTGGFLADLEFVVDAPDFFTSKETRNFDHISSS